MNSTDNIRPNLKLRTTTLGDCIRSLRKKERLPLRKVAAQLDIDPSTLGKFEKNTRYPSREVIQGLSELFKVDIKPLWVYSMSDRLVEDLQNEELKFEIIKITERKLKRNQKTNSYENK